MAVVTNAIEFDRYVFDLPATWEFEADAAHLVAAEPNHEGPFLANLVLIPTRDDYPDPLVGIAEIAGSVVLGVSRFAGVFPAIEVVFGYPTDRAAVTVVRLVGAPTPSGRLIATFSVDAPRFATLWPGVSTALGTLQEIR